MKYDISITRTTTPKAKPTDESKLGFGKIFTDHMFLMNYSTEKGWHDPRVVPYGPISLDPSAMVFHYAQELFEGMKAYRRPDGASDENRVRGGIFRRDLTPKKAALELKRLFTEEWHTEAVLTTNEAGEVSFRGFYGDYEAEIDGKTLSFGLHKNQTDSQKLKI